MKGIKNENELTRDSAKRDSAKQEDTLLSVPYVTSQPSVAVYIVLC